MGLLRDKAKAQSKFLILQKGESAIVQHQSFKFIPHEKDPTLEVALFEFLENGKVKFWKSGSSSVWLTMDAVNRNDWIKISRNKKMKADGMEDPTKSVYVVEVMVGYVPGPVPETAAAPIASPGTIPQGEPANVGPAADPFAAKPATSVPAPSGMAVG